MALTAAQLEAILTLDKSNFDKELQDALGTTQRTKRDFETWGKDVGKAINDGVVLLGAGAAGMAATVTKVGIDYNTLQQRSRAALETLLGSSEAAEAQLRELDAWADNSPFAREIFYEAQQQLIGFGTEAELVVPILDGVQDAVAAVGGTNEDIKSVVDTLANMQGQGRLSGEELRRLGQYGIDAASIIGDEMGHTGEEIREMASRPGGIPVDQVWEPLTAGLESRFGGAAEAVKDTYVGALDRIKAASRDIGGEIARPFVDPDGGGRAVDWANDFADLLRAVESQIPSLVGTMDDRLSPAFDTFRIRMKDATDAVNSWDAADLESILDELGAHVPTIAGLSAAMFTLATSNIPVIGGLTSALGPLPAAIGAAALASPEMRDGLSDILEAGQPLIGVLADLAGVASGTFVTGLEASATVLSGVADVIGPVVEWFADLPDPIRNAATAALIFNAAGGPTSKVLGNITDGAKNLGTGIGNVVDTFGGWAGTFEGATGNLDDFRAAVSLVGEDIGRSASTGLRGAANGIMGLFGGPWGVAIMGATALITLYAQEQAEAKARVDELKNSLDEQTGAFTESTEAMVGAEVLQVTTMDTLENMGLTLTDVTDAILNGGEAYDHVSDRILAYSDELENNGVQLRDIQDELVPLEELIRAEAEASEEAREIKRIEVETRRQLHEELDEGQRSYERYMDAVLDLADTTKTTEERVRALDIALDELNGGQRSTEERQRALAEQTRNLSEFMADSVDETDGFKDSLFDLDEGIIDTTEEGNRLAEMLDRMGREARGAATEQVDLALANGDFNDAVIAAEEAVAPYVEDVRELGREFGYSEEAIDLMIQQMGLVPEEIAFLIDDGDSISETEFKVWQLTREIDELPDGETHITDEGTSQDVIDILEDLNYDVRTLDDGTVEVTSSGTQTTMDEIQAVADGPYNATINVRTYVDDLGGMMPNVPSFLPTELGGNRYYGAIDRFKGMFAGGITGNRIMDIAQFVKPGDIRFAGDRSDVDEAWIPLDGSQRSIAILNEAIARMPGYDPDGMRYGGITGHLTPPQVEGVDAPDTEALQQVWAETMAYLEESTRNTFGAIEDDTAASQDATTEATATNMATMRDTIATTLATMAAVTATNMATMDDDTARHIMGMRDTTGTHLATMFGDTDAYTTAMRDTTAARFLAMQQDATSKADLLRYGVSRHFFDMHDYAATEAAGLRSDSNTEFTNLRDHGIDAAGELRAGVVSEMGQARSPFTRHVNNLVDVMREFSESMNKAYGDMGVDVGSPDRVSMWTGGVLPGYTPGTDIHSFFSPTGGRLDLSGGEGVSRPEVVQAMGVDTFNALNAAARSGGVSGVRRMLSAAMQHQALADGGIIDDFTGDAKRIGTEFKGKLPDNWLRPAGWSIIDQVVENMNDALAAIFSGEGWVRPTTGRVTSPYGPRGGGFHAGMDIADTPGTHTYAPTAGRVLETGWNIGPGRTGIGAMIELIGGLYTYMGHNSPGGLKVKPGDLVAPGQRVGDQGTTGNVTGAHLHWEIHKGAPWRDISPHPFWDAAGGGGYNLGGPNDQWTSTIMQALRLAGLPTTGPYVSAWQRQIQTESGGNPRAVQQIHDINSVMGNHARGLVQVIPPTFAAYSMPGMRDIFNPLHNLTAGMRYARSRYGITGMLQAIGQGRGYEDGTDHALPGWAWVGEAGPELVNFRGGERVMSHGDSMAAVGGTVELSEQSLKKLATRMADEIHKRPQVVIDGPSVTSEAKMAREVSWEFRKENMRLSRR